MTPFYVLMTLLHLIPWYFIFFQWAVLPYLKIYRGILMRIIWFDFSTENIQSPSYSWRVLFTPPLDNFLVEACVLVIIGSIDISNKYSYFLLNITLFSFRCTVATLKLVTIFSICNYDAPLLTLSSTYSIW